MAHQDFSFLLNHFVYETIDLKSNHRFSEILNKKNKITYPEFNHLQYAIVFYDKGTDEILSWGLSSSKDNNYESFEFYLNQLPQMTLANVTYFFSLIGPDMQLINNLFNFSDNYQSKFCRAFLNDTYGNVVYTYQLMQLIDSCMPFGKSGTDLMNEYRKGFNGRLRKTFDQLERMRLPDGYNLGEFLKQCTPIRSNKNSSAYGFVITPVHAIAHKFIVCAENYIS